MGSRSSIFGIEWNDERASRIVCVSSLTLALTLAPGVVSRGRPSVCHGHSAPIIPGPDLTGEDLFAAALHNHDILRARFVLPHPHTLVFFPFRSIW